LPNILVQIWCARGEFATQQQHHSLALVTYSTLQRLFRTSTLVLLGEKKPRWASQRGFTFNSVTGLRQRQLRTCAERQWRKRQRWNQQLRLELR
jgi:hypothetical protein